MVYTKDKVADALHAALLTNPSPLMKGILEAERTKQNLVIDKGANQNAAFNYLLQIQSDNKFVPGYGMLNAHLAWINANKASLDTPTLDNLTNIVRNIVGGSAYAAGVRERLQDFKRVQLLDFSDTDPVESVVFTALKDLQAAADDKLVKAALATLSSIDYLIPVTL